VSSWSNPFDSLKAGAACWVALCACALPCFSGAAPASAAPAAAPAAAPQPAPASPAAGPANTVPAAGPPHAEEPIPERAAQQYRQALDMMRSGRDTDAELELKQLSAAYPQFAGPPLNLGLLYLKDSKLAEAETALKSAVQINPANAQAGNELGIVERRLGKFAEAEAAYQRTISADPNYAPAHLNLGVLYDLYLAEPRKALDEFERYLEIAGDGNKQVAGWVVELRKRVGASAAKKEQPV
jgi:tetratricopeptide (TPR) repeat protein